MTSLTSLAIVLGIGQIRPEILRGRNEMNATTRNLLQTILTDEGGYFSIEQGRALLADEATRRLPVVIRYYWGRQTLSLADALTQVATDIALADSDIRDWFLSAAECDRLAPLVGVTYTDHGYTLAAV